jgi:mannose-1-phosphate guanylyltransferase/mannose-6-phosphate isomerase
VVIEMPDVVLVAERSSSQSVKSLIAELNNEGRRELDLDKKVYRPWGWYKDIDYGDGYKVKRIFVEPGESLSLQQHFHRSEHWTIVRGTAKVEYGDVAEIVQENKSVYIPLGSIHRLSHPGHTALEVIEVQTGNYLSEDDIVRHEDKYGRH